MDLQLTRILYHEDGTPISEEKRFEIPQITNEDFIARLREINETYQIIRDPRTGQAFEIAIVNTSQLKNGVILIPSTMFSSLTQNPGNAVELAANGAATPHIARVYLAFPGNGGSSNLSRADRHYLSRTGRFTQDDLVVESISALVRALDSHNFLITNISANGESGRLGLGIMAALPPNTVTSAYFNGLPGISPLLHDSYTTSMVREDRAQQQRRQVENAEERYQVSDRMIKEVRSFLPNIYQGVNYRIRLLSTYMRALPNMRTYIQAFSHYDDLQVTETHAVFQDTLIALQRQRQVKITFQFGLYSEIHSIMECQKFCQKVTEELRKVPNQSSIQLFIHQGSLDFFSAFPSKHWAAEKAALMLQ